MPPKTVKDLTRKQVSALRTTYNSAHLKGYRAIRFTNKTDVGKLRKSIATFNKAKK